MSSRNMDSDPLSFHQLPSFSHPLTFSTSQSPGFPAFHTFNPLNPINSINRINSISPINRRPGASASRPPIFCALEQFEHASAIEQLYHPVSRIQHLVSQLLNRLTSQLPSFSYAHTLLPSHLLILYPSPVLCPTGYRKMGKTFHIFMS